MLIWVGYIADTFRTLYLLV